MGTRQWRLRRCEIPGVGKVNVIGWSNGAIN
jgi:hypothetical protein